MKYLYRKNEILLMLYPMIITSVLMLLSNSSSFFFFICASVSVIVAIRWYNYLSDLDNIELASFFSTCIFSAYVLTSFSTQINLYSLGYGSAAEYFNIDQFYLSQALFVIVLSCFILDFWGLLKPTKLNISSAELVNNRAGVNFFVIVCFIMLCYCFINGLIGFQGDIYTTENKNEISALASLVVFVMPFIGALSFFIATSSKERWEKISFFVISMVTLLLLFTQGRRLLIFSGILYFISYRQGSNNRKISIKLWIMLFFLSLALYIGFMFFFALRMAYYQFDSSLLDLVINAVDILLHPSNSDFSEKLAENMLERPFIIGYLGELLKLTKISNYFWGHALFNNFLMSIPSVLYSKANLLIDEDLIHPALGLPVVDEANSILTAGLADFGMVGAIVFTVLMFIYCRTIYILVYSYFSSWLAFLVWLSILNCFLSVESSITSVFVLSKNIVIVIFCCKVCSLLKKLLIK